METEAVQAERERREQQDLFWDKARSVTREIVEGLDEGEWLTTTAFLSKIQENVCVGRNIAVELLHEFRDTGKVVYSLSKGYRKPATQGKSGNDLITRPEDIKRRNDFLVFIAEMQAEARTYS